MKKLSTLFKNQPFNNENKQGKTKSSRYTKSSFDFLSLIEKWPDIVGERLAKHTIPLKNTRGVLTILTNHSSFSQQLSFMEEVLIKKITDEFPSLNNNIRQIKFQNNSQHFDMAAKAQISLTKVKKEESNESLPHPYSPEYRQLKKEADTLFQEIQDHEIKETLSSIFMQGRHQK